MNFGLKTFGFCASLSFGMCIGCEHLRYQAVCSLSLVCVCYPQTLSRSKIKAHWAGFNFAGGRANENLRQGSKFMWQFILEPIINFAKVIMISHHTEKKKNAVTSNQVPYEAGLWNVNSFTRSKTLELNFTPKKARKSRQSWYVGQTKLKTSSQASKLR